MQKKPQLATKLFGNVSPNTPKIIDIDISHILPNPDQPRKTFDEESLRELADSIERHGLLQPVTVKRKEDDPDRYILVAGERRFRAHQLLGRSRVFGIVLTSGNTDELAIIENLQREDLSPIEEAEALAKLMERYQYTQEALGKVVGKAQATVSNLLNLNKLPERIKQEYSAAGNKVSRSLLMEIARHNDQGEQLQLWDFVKSGDATVRAARQAKKESGPFRKAAPAAKQAISAGRLFARRLESLSGPEIFDDPADVRELAAIRDEIYQQVGRFQSPQERVWQAAATLRGLLLQFPDAGGMEEEIAALGDKLAELTASSEAKGIEPG